MIPVEYTAGGTALCTHHKSEGTPDKYADKVAYVEGNRYHKQSDLTDDAVEIQNSDNGNKCRPDQHDHISRRGGGDYVFFQSLAVYLFADGLKTVGKELLRAEGYLVFDRYDLQEHIGYPYQPQDMEDREGFEKIHSVKDIKALGTGKAEYGTYYEYNTSAYKSYNISSSGF